LKGGNGNASHLPVTLKASPAATKNLESNTFNEKKQEKGEKQIMISLKDKGGY
jgi:hypothetical protein